MSSQGTNLQLEKEVRLTLQEVVRWIKENLMVSEQTIAWIHISMAPSAVWFPYNLHEGLQGRCDAWELQKQTVTSIMTPITWWVLLTKYDQKNRKLLHTHAPEVHRRKAPLSYLSCWEECWMPPGALWGHLVQENHLVSLSKKTEFDSELGTGRRTSLLCLDLISLWLELPVWLPQ